mgnify:FL=1
MIVRKNYIKKSLSIILGIIFAVIISLPYVLFRTQVQDMYLLGYFGVFLSCLISNASIMLPTSSTIIVVVASSTLNPWICALLGGVGTALGEQSSYICGRLSVTGIKEFNNKKIRDFLTRHEFLTIFVFAFIPLPIFDVIGLACGAAKTNWLKYTLAVTSGKLLKFVFALLLFYYIIPHLKPFLFEPFSSIFNHLYKTLGI